MARGRWITEILVIADIARDRKTATPKPTAEGGGATRDLVIGRASQTICIYWKEMPPNPKSVKVNVTTGAGMDIEWDDGHRTHYGFQWLRDACPCATCTEERNNHGRKPGEPAKAAATLLPMYKEPARPKEVKPVGRYALNIAWNDGHASGIYSWDYLRELCQCEECRARVAAG
jgi:DUF971 family protein